MTDCAEHPPLAGPTDAAATSAPGAARARPPEPVTEAVVVSDHALIAESVRAALRSRGFEARTLRWPDAGPRRPDTVGEPVAPAPRRREHTVGLLITELDRPALVREARALFEAVPVPWVVLAGVGRGPIWGGVLDAGARMVISSSEGLTRIVTCLQQVARQGLVPDDPDRAELVAAWREVVEQRRLVVERMAELTPREQEVLRRLYTGEPVAQIATAFSVTEATVRSQVKSMLRKLDVNSQLAAVAAFVFVASDEELSAALQDRAGR